MKVTGRLLGGSDLAQGFVAGLLPQPRGRGAARFRVPVAPAKAPTGLGCAEVGAEPSTPQQQQRGAGFQHPLPQHLVNYRLTARHQAGASPLRQPHAATVPVKQLTHGFMARGSLGSRAGGHRAAASLPHTPGSPPVPAA